MDTCIQVTDDGGKTFRKRGREVQARRQPRAVDRPRRHRPPARRLRRRPLRDLRPRRDLALHRQPAGDPVLQGRRRTTRAVLQRLRRHAGQQHPGRPVAHHHRPRHHRTRTGSSPSAATASRPASTRRTRTSSTPSRSTAACVRYDRRSGEQRRHPAAAGRRRAAAALELGLAADHQPALAHAALLRRQPALPQRRPRRLLAARSAPTSRARSTATSCRVMGRVWSVDAVAKNTSTSFYGNIVALAESPLNEGLLYVGTDDGLIQVTEDGGATWRKHRALPRRARAAPTSRASSPRATTPNTVYAAFDNHKIGDFKPYVLKSTDRGRDLDVHRRRPARARHRSTRWSRTTWTGTCSSSAPSSACSSPDGGQTLDPAQGRPADHRRASDLAIQERENDLAGRHLRPRLLHPRRLLAAAHGRRGDAGPGERAVPGAPALGLHAGLPARATRARASRGTASSPRPTRPSARSSPTT